MSMKNETTQSEYNKQHNMYRSKNGQTAYQMLIEQVVTGERTYTPIQMKNANEQDALDEALLRLEFRDIIGYIPSGIIKRMKTDVEIPQLSRPSIRKGPALKTIENIVEFGSRIPEKARFNPA